MVVTTDEYHLERRWRKWPTWHGSSVVTSMATRNVFDEEEAGGLGIRRQWLAITNHGGFVDHGEDSCDWRLRGGSNKKKAMAN